MDDLGSIVGIISGLIAIFSFVTGSNSLAELWKLKRTPESAATRGTRFVVRRLLLIIPLFGVSITVTAAMGLSGSDTGGILSLLLIICLLVVLGYRWFGVDSVVSLTVYGPITTIAITVAGFLFGVISRGEEAFGLMAGLAIGAGSWAITALTRHQYNAAMPDLPERPATEEGVDAAPGADRERTILEIASQHKGQVRVTDIVLESNIALDDAAQALDSLVQRGYCRRETLDSGATVYRFPDLEVQ